MILNQGVRTYKFKNSKNELVAAEEETKGSIFGYRSKEDMISARGFVMTSIEALEENANQLTHWTPNVYRLVRMRINLVKLHEATLKGI